MQLSIQQTDKIYHKKINLSMLYKNRQHAGQMLALALRHLQKKENLMVLGLPRGGVVCAAEVAAFLRCPLDVIICRKLGAPGNEEFAIGAISEAGGEFLNTADIVEMYGDEKYLEKVKQEELEKIKKYQQEFRAGMPLPLLKQKTVIVVDDGAATGMTMKAAIDAARKQEAAKITVALPVSPQETAEELRARCDELVILMIPPFFQAVGQFYEDFRQVETEKVKKILKDINHQS